MFGLILGISLSSCYILLINHLCKPYDKEELHKWK